MCCNKGFKGAPCDAHVHHTAANYLPYSVTVYSLLWDYGCANMHLCIQETAVWLKELEEYQVCVANMSS
jgi:hypothetical protein